MAIEVRSCPSCGCDEIEFEVYWSYIDETKSKFPDAELTGHRGRCAECGYLGPISVRILGFHGVIERWNREAEWCESLKGDEQWA